MGVEPVEDLRGSLAFTTLTDVIQFLHSTGRTGELWVEGGPDQRAAQIYFQSGTVYHAQVGSATGIDTLVDPVHNAPRTRVSLVMMADQKGELPRCFGRSEGWLLMKM